MQASEILSSLNAMTTDLAFGSKTPTITICWTATDRAGELLVERV
ncbi:hypothetical protein [Pseudomonas synxantha]